MPIWLHVILVIVSQMVSLAVFGSALMFGAAFGWFDGKASYFIVLFIATPILAILLPRYFFDHLLPAKCPKCGGPAIFRYGRPITYRCQKCRRIHRTRWNERDNPW